MDYPKNFESIYTGGHSGLDPGFNDEYFIGKRMGAGYLGFPGSPGTANQLGELVNAAKQGVKAFEVTALVPDTAETIPKQHFKEMRAIMKLSGIKPSVHGPLIDPAGFGEKGWEKEEGRANNERRMFKALADAHTLDPEGNTPVVFHAGNGTPGKVFQPGDEKKGEERFIWQKGAAINRETGQIAPLEREHKFRPHDPDNLEKGGTLFKPEDQVASANRSEWDNELVKISEFAKSAHEVIGSSPIHLKAYQNARVIEQKDGMHFIDEKTKVELEPLKTEEEKDAYNRLQKADQFLENAQLSFNAAFNKAYKYGTPEQKGDLKKLAKDYKNDFMVVEGYVEKKGKIIGKDFPSVWGPVNKQKMIDKYAIELGKITSHETPEIFQEAEEFAVENASKTFSNLATQAYDKWEENSPILAIENLMPGMAFSRTKELKQLVEKTRDQFAENLVKEKGMSKGKAKKIAAKQVGVTWDLGHLNLLRKTGFEEKDLIKETEKIAPLVKHIHLTDNFGHADTHLPVGMGNVPFKEHLEALEKKGDLKGVRRIVEAGNFVKDFKSSPHPMTLRAFGSPVYGMKQTSGGYWNQGIGTMGAYFGGYGTINPQTHHSIYGAGLTTLPMELGGNIPGGGSRFSGNSMT